MKQYKIEGYGKYKGFTAYYMTNGSAKEALEFILDKNGISYNKIVKLTNKENKELLDKGIEPYTKIDFVVENIKSTNKIISIGNYSISI